jgi:hypothetical protein
MGVMTAAMPLRRYRIDGLDRFRWRCFDASAC